MPAKNSGKVLRKEYDYSELKKDLVLQVESEGQWYVGSVVAISDAAKRSKAPVKVNYKGYEGYDEWVNGDRLRSKALKVKIPQAKEEKTKSPPKPIKMRAAATHVTLADGHKMPTVGYGTFRSAPGEVGPAVLEAIKAGYRHLDFAHVYCNEKEVGAALKEALSTGLVKREDLFLVGKLWNSDHDVEVVPKAYERSCQDLCVEYLDLYLIHFPVAVKHTGLDNPCFKDAELGTTPLIDTWRAMEALVEAKKVRSIGVSNYPLVLLHDLVNQAKVPIAVNQIEVHANYVREDLVNYCISRNIAVTCHTPLGGGAANAGAWGISAVPIEEPLVKSIARRVKKSPGQVLLRWLLQRGCIVIPKSVKPARIAENFDLFSFELTQIDVDKIAGLDRYSSAKTNPNPQGHFIGTKDGMTPQGTDIFD